MNHESYVKSVMSMRKKQRERILDELETLTCPCCESTSLVAETLPEILDEMFSVVCETCMAEFTGNPRGDSFELVEELLDDDEEEDWGDDE